MNFTKSLLFLSSLFFGVIAYSQTASTDSCAITPLYTASFEGIQEKGMLSVEAVSRFRKMIPGDDGTTILRFTFSIDCDKCELYMKEVYSDTLSADDQQRMKKVNGGQVISFECIVGKNKKGELVSYKPFLFYIKP
jgi:hypothetical protein